MDFAALGELVPRLFGVLGLLVLSAYFSGSETALFSLSRVQREKLGRSSSATDRYASVLLKDPRRLVVTILLGNEVVNIAISALVAGAAQRVMPAYGPVAVTIGATVVAVPLVLVLGEITPKSIALRIAEKWAWFTARPLGFLSIVLTPPRLVVTAVSVVIVRILGGRPAPTAKPIGEAEFKALVDAGSAEGALEASEKLLIHNVFAFRDRSISTIMTPARKVFALSFELPLARIAQEAAKSGYSRIPIYKGKRDNVVGILYSKDLVGLSSGRLTGKTVKDLIQQPNYAPKSTKCDRLFREFQRSRTHMAMVVDEYGRLAGLVTMEDLLEELFGEIKEEKLRRAADAPPPTGEVVKVDPSDLEKGPS